ncbi:MAG: glycerol-3-phosphate cytidylyltransferase [Candidatus Marinimicrobia bacterium]|nr:glycerol-3-phosphate cytidylyltransferase [Candidatus Neomarinimicrobiota bacterium]
MTRDNNKREKYKLGYTTGVFDLFHIGHLKLLKRAKNKCEKLIVGVTIDELVSYKHKEPVISFADRAEIVKSIEYVDNVVPQVSMDKMAAWEKLGFDVMFVGDDWKGTAKWKIIEKDFKIIGVDIVYFPYTEGTSSTLINNILINRRNRKSNEKENND